SAGAPRGLYGPRAVIDCSPRAVGGLSHAAEASADESAPRALRVMSRKEWLDRQSAQLCAPVPSGETLNGPRQQRCKAAPETRPGLGLCAWRRARATVGGRRQPGYIAFAVDELERTAAWNPGLI